MPYGAVSYHEDPTYPRASGYQNDEDFRMENRRQKKDGMEGGDEKRSREEQIMAKRGDKHVDQNGMR